MKFDASNKEHRLIVTAAMVAADALGQGRITAAKEQLEMQGITPYLTRAEQDAFQRAVLDFGANL